MIYSNFAVKIQYSNLILILGKLPTTRILQAESFASSGTPRERTELPEIRWWQNNQTFSGFFILSENAVGKIFENISEFRFFAKMHKRKKHNISKNAKFWRKNHSLFNCHWWGSNWLNLCEWHDLDRRGQRTKSRDPNGLLLKVGSRRAQNFLLANNVCPLRTALRNCNAGQNLRKSRYRS